MVDAEEEEVGRRRMERRACLSGATASHLALLKKFLILSFSFYTMIFSNVFI